jgi:L-rhamnose-H+ transport protein
MFFGLFLALLSGICFSNCFIPVRYLNKFAWENIWFIYSLFGLALFPVLVAEVTIPSLLGLYREIGWRMNLVVASAGLLGGGSAVLYGLALARVGMAQVNGLGNGIALLAGSFVPLLIQHREAMRGGLGLSLLLGAVLAVLGVVLCALAASQRQEESAYMSPDQQKGHSHARIAFVGVLCAIGYGILGSNMNFGLAFAPEYFNLARLHGASEAFAANAFYVPLSVPGFLGLSLYCGFLWRKNGTLAQFRRPSALRLSFWCVFIAAVWFFGGMILYGWAMPGMKTYGPVIGWPVCLTASTLASAVVEYFYGDWKGRALRTLSCGLVALTASIAIFGYANLLVQTAD